jgi:TPR repeat protein
MRAWSKDGCARLALAQVRGEGIAKNVIDGRAHLESGCMVGEAFTCELAARLYDSGNGSDVPADAPRARSYRAQACTLGWKESCETLSLDWGQPGPDTDAAK